MVVLFVVNFLFSHSIPKMSSINFKKFQLNTKNPVGVKSLFMDPSVKMACDSLHVFFT